MELRHLRYFLAVAEELNFSRAAKKLHIAQPPLSQQIQQLEAEIGTQLFTRTNHRVQLTSAGSVFLPEVRAILARVEQAVEAAKRANRGEVGQISIGFVASAMYEVLPSIIRQFRMKYADVELTLMELSSTEQCQALAEKRIDLGFLRLPTPKEGIIYDQVYSEALVVALPESHKLASRDQLPLRELNNEGFILYPSEPESNFGSYVINSCAEAGFVPNIIQRTDEVQTAVGLVGAGVGIAVVPASTQCICREGVVYRQLIEPMPTIDLTLGYRADDHSPILMNFIELCRQSKD